MECGRQRHFITELVTYWISQQALDVMAQRLRGDGSQPAAQPNSLSAASAAAASTAASGFHGRAAGNTAHAAAAAGAAPALQQDGSNSSSGSSTEPCPWDDYPPDDIGLNGHTNGSSESDSAASELSSADGSLNGSGSFSSEGSVTRMVFSSQALSSGRYLGSRIAFIALK